MNIDPLCIDRLTLDRAPELIPFVFQEFMDFRLDGADLEEAYLACRRIMEQSKRRRFFSAELIRANLLLVIGIVCQRYERELLGFAASGPRGIGGNPVLAGVSRYIGARLIDRISLAEVAVAIGVSPNHVTRLLKRETGKTFMQLLTERRLQRAQELLTNTTMRIADIGEAAGFEDNAYFARRFKQVFRISPRAYRNAAASET